MAAKADVVDRCVLLRDALADKSRTDAYPDARRGQFRLHAIMIGVSAEDFNFSPAHGEHSDQYDHPLAAVERAIDREQSAVPGDEGAIDACLEANVAARHAVKAVTRT